MIATLDSTLLDLPEALLQLLPPANNSYWFRVPSEGFAQRTGVQFDLLAAAATAADLSYAALLNQQRLERLQQMQISNDDLPSVGELLDQIEQQLQQQIKSAGNARQQALAGVLQQRYVASLLQLDSMSLSAALAASIQQRLQQLQTRLAEAGKRDRLHAQQQWLARRIARQLQRPAPASSAIPAQLTTPPGSPIGSGGDHWISESCWHCDEQ